LIEVWKRTKKENDFRIRNWWGRMTGERSECLNGSGAKYQHIYETLSNFSRLKKALRPLACENIVLLFSDTE
jgi:hypothetical protein